MNRYSTYIFLYSSTTVYILKTLYKLRDGSVHTKLIWYFSIFSGNVLLFKISTLEAYGVCPLLLIINLLTYNYLTITWYHILIVCLSFLIQYSWMSIPPPPPHSVVFKLTTESVLPKSVSDNNVISCQT